jgi:hypothetical protein
MPSIRTISVSGSVPSITQLALGDLAVNTFDGKAYIKKQQGNTQTIVNIGSGAGGGVTQIIAGTNITISPVGGTGIVTVNANNPVSASYALSSSYAANGGVTQLLAGANISLSPTNGLGQVIITSTGGSGGFNTATGSYGSFYDTGSVLAASATQIYSMSLSTTDISNGVFVSASAGDTSRIKFTNAGVYNVQFSAQFSNSDNSIQDVVIWVRKNGTDIVDSSGVAGVPPFKAGSNGQVVAGWNYYLSLSTNDYIQLCWHVEQANVITLETIAAGTSPTHPRTPSLILTANRVDQFLSNTGSFSGSFIGSHTGSFTGSFTGSLFGTSSWASNSISSSYALTASLAPLYVLNSRTSSFATTGSNTFKDNQIVTGSITSTSEITAAGNVTAQINLKSMYQSGDEGGEIFLNAPATNTTIPNGVTIDVYQNRLRIFEQGGAANGYYLEMPSGSAGVGTNLKPAGFTGPVTIASNPPPNTLNFIDGILINIT